MGTHVSKSASFSGYVIDSGTPGRRAEFCGSVIAASAPPQGIGPSLNGWDWDALEHDEDRWTPPDMGTEVIVRSGPYAFQGQTEPDGSITVDPRTVLRV
ncbi:hypothetical protein [Microbacterium sp. NPDC055683]